MGRALRRRGILSTWLYRYSGGRETEIIVGMLVWEGGGDDWSSEFVYEEH